MKNIEDYSQYQNLNFKGVRNFKREGFSMGPSNRVLNFDLIPLVLYWIWL